MLLALLTIGVFQSCDKEKDFYDTEIIADKKGKQDVPIVKEFELKESWFSKANSTKSLISGDIYANFGVGYDVLEKTDMLSIFNPNVSVEPIISTTLEEKTDLVYISTSEYSQIDNMVSTKLAASLNVNTSWVKANGNLSISSESRVTNTSNSVYISVLYVKRYGKGTLQFTAPTINDYLTYRTNLNDNSGSDGIPYSNDIFRGIFGDRFKTNLTFGVMLVGTIQIVNVDFQNSTREEVAAQAQMSVKNMVEVGVSWESQKTSNSHFINSDIIITGTAIPNTSSYIFNRDDLVREIGYMDQCYANSDLGIIAHQYTEFHYLYPTYNFINVDNELRYNLSTPIYSVSYAGDYPTNGQILTLNSGAVQNNIPTLLGRGFSTNFDQSLLQPIYHKIRPTLTTFFWDFSNQAPYSGSYELACYVYKTKLYPELVPLYKVWIGSGSFSLKFLMTTTPGSDPNIHYQLLGWIYPY